MRDTIDLMSTERSGIKGVLDILLSLLAEVSEHKLKGLKNKKGKIKKSLSMKLLIRKRKSMRLKIKLLPLIHLSLYLEWDILLEVKKTECMQVFTRTNFYQKNLASNNLALKLTKEFLEIKLTEHFLNLLLCRKLFILINLFWNKINLLSKRKLKQYQLQEMILQKNIWKGIEV